jgi:hypothetical protein
MKKRLFILGAFTGCLELCTPACAQSYLWNTTKGAELYVSGRMVNVRASASLSAAVTDSLACGSAVMVLEETTALSTINGIAAPWLKVSYQKDNMVKEAFAWLGLLAVDQYRSGNTVFLYGVDRIAAAGQGDDYQPAIWSVSVKALDSNRRLLDQKALTISDVDVAASSGKLLGKLGLKNALDILRIQFGGEACGIPTNYYYFAWSGSRLLPLPGKMEVSDAGSFYHTETLLFPGEPGGETDKLILLEEEGEEQGKTDKEGNPVFKIRKSRRVYHWDGGKARLKPGPK